MAVPAARMRSRQGGIALVTAILLVAMATIAAVTMAARQHYDLRRTGNLLEGDQAYAYAVGVETWAEVILKRDAEDSDIDHLNEAWATRLAPVAVEGGQITGSLQDLQGRFNLNGLVAGGDVSEPDLEQFRRLLTNLDIPIEVADAVIDWLDPDIDTRFPNGAEDNEYLLFKTPYRAANRAMVSPTELRLIRGLEAEHYARLAPHVTVLPEPTPINVNTASVPVLQSLAENMTLAEAEQLIQARGEEGFETVQAFLQEDALAGRQLDAGRVTVSSQYFLARAEVDIGRARSLMYSVLQRDAGQVVSLQRGRGVW